MLLLLFRAGETSYAIEARRVVEVVPRVALRLIPHAPYYVLGLLAYRGRVVPVIDFASLAGLGERKGPVVLSSRIILADYPGVDHSLNVIGLAAENVSRVIEVKPDQVVSPAMGLNDAPYLAEVVRMENGLTQVVRADKFLSQVMRDALYGVPIGTEPT